MMKKEKQMQMRNIRMKIALDTHTHTISSGHAYSTMREMAQMAKEKGLEALAITDHAPSIPGAGHEYHFINLKIMPRELYGVKLFLGVEANLMDEDGTLDMNDALLEELDIVIASIHPPCYKGPATVEAVTNAYMKAMENPHVDIIGHPDDGRYPVDYEAFVEKAKETGTLIEINNSSLKPGSYRPNAEGNARKILELCKKHHVQITLGSDAHFDADIAEYGYAMKLLKECDFPEELVVNTSVDKLQKVLDI